MLRVTPMVVQGMAETAIPDCGTGVAGATAGGTLTGSIVDRLALPRHFTHAQPFLVGAGLSNTSTGGIKRALLDVFLQHGDSSGGGDMAELNTGLRVAQQALENTVRTTDEVNWTTGTLRAHHYSNPYHLLPAKRFIRAGGIVTRGGVTTATAAGNLLAVSLGLNLMGADNEPPSHLAQTVDGRSAQLFATATAT